MTKKKPTIKFAKRALDAIPSEEQKEVRNAIEEAFEDFDPNNPPGQPVTALPAGSTTCPRCRAPLDFLGPSVEGHGGVAFEFAECEKCDRPFMVPARN